MSQLPSTLPSLGSLSQSARAKELRSARGILIAIGILSIIANIAFMALAAGMVDSELEKEMQKQGLSRATVDREKYDEVRNAAIRATYLMDGVGAVLGGIFIILGVMVYKRPVACTVTGLVLYIAAALAFGLLDPTTLLRGAIIKIIIIVALIKSISAAIAYQKAQAAAPPPAVPPAPPFPG